MRIKEKDNQSTQLKLWDDFKFDNYYLLTFFFNLFWKSNKILKGKLINLIKKKKKKAKCQAFKKSLWNLDHTLYIFGCLTHDSLQWMLQQRQNCIASFHLFYQWCQRSDVAMSKIKIESNHTSWTVLSGQLEMCFQGSWASERLAVLLSLIIDGKIRNITDYWLWGYEMPILVWLRLKININFYF